MVEILFIIFFHSSLFIYFNFFSAKCKRVIQEGKDSCMNLECPFGSGLKSPQNVTSLNILAILKDDTGYLIGCRLRDEAAERALGCTAEELKV